MKLGREIVRMIHDVRKAAGADVGYARRTFTFPGGEVYIFVANSPAVADAFDKGAAATHDVVTTIPPSTKN